MPKLESFPTETALAEAAAAFFTALGRHAIRERGVYRAALSGGRGPRGMFRVLAGLPKALDWSKVELYWVDERWVDVESPESNYGEAGRMWLDRLRPAPARFPMYDPNRDPEAAAKAYAQLLKKRFNAELPVLDLALLGMGQDGHTASLFPGQPSLKETGRLCLAVRQPATGQQRLTLTYPVLKASRRCAFIVQGSEKADLLGRVLAGRVQVPAAQVSQAEGEVLWMADAEAASRVRQAP
jgi:6-phosphogluconolactonase